MYISNNRELFYKACRVRNQSISKEAHQRLDLIKKYYRLKHKISLSEICKILDVKRSTLYRWLKAYNSKVVLGLEPKSRCPKHKRKPQWTDEQQRRICEIRHDYPFWGKAKIAVIMRREGHTLSESSVGRILDKLKKLGRITPVVRKKVLRKRPRNRFKGHSQRWKYGDKADKPGELVQVDHMSVQTNSFVSVKHFDAICPVTRFSVAEVYSRATALSAKRFLDKMIEKFPFSIKSIQVDGGSEFMAEFEQACEEKDIELYVLPPRRPQYNGAVERCNGTFRYEFYGAYEQAETIKGIRKDLDTFQELYNDFRPHQSLKNMTPMEYINTLQYDAL